ncbi:hypothetical protein BDW74DRAFT_159460, partial [Aspergillus multicolor]|uniref:uncharacterized protein n=1 Tax=Aspergillus multicolor TaxID=41759 RepID=UPI003CCD65F5
MVARSPQCPRGSSCKAIDTLPASAPLPQSRMTSESRHAPHVSDPAARGVPSVRCSETAKRIPGRAFWIRAKTRL